MNKLCDKCGGYMNREEDFDGSFWGCINCGRHINVNTNQLYEEVVGKLKDMKGVKQLKKRDGRWGTLTKKR